MIRAPLTAPFRLDMETRLQVTLALLTTHRVIRTPLKHHFPLNRVLRMRLCPFCGPEETSVLPHVVPTPPIAQYIRRVTLSSYNSMKPLTLILKPPTLIFPPCLFFGGRHAF